jgi:hypothetical protein
MHQRHFEARLRSIREKLKRRFPFLVEDDMVYREDHTDEFCERLRHRIGISREEVGALINEIINEIINEPISGRA